MQALTILLLVGFIVMCTTEASYAFGEGNNDMAWFATAMGVVAITLFVILFNWWYA